jgi:hypothetical protein
MYSLRIPIQFWRALWNATERGKKKIPTLAAINGYDLPIVIETKGTRLTDPTFFLGF